MWLVRYRYVSRSFCPNWCTLPMMLFTMLRRVLSLLVLLCKRTTVWRSLAETDIASRRCRNLETRTRGSLQAGWAGVLECETTTDSTTPVAYVKQRTIQQLHAYLLAGEGSVLKMDDLPMPPWHSNHHWIAWGSSILILEYRLFTHWSLLSFPALILDLGWSKAIVSKDSVIVGRIYEHLIEDSPAPLHIGRLRYCREPAVTQLTPMN